MIAKDVVISGEELKAWTSRVFERVSVPKEDAATAADVLVSANLRGVDTHGVIRMTPYLRRLRAGATNPQPEIQVIKESPATMLVDGDNGLGSVVGTWAMTAAIQRARDTGVAVVSVRHSNHTGMGAYYARLAAAADMIGICLSNTDSDMAPWGSKTPYLGTNPLAFAAPGGIEGGIVLDMATSQVSHGKIVLAALAGEKIPSNWATNRDGQPTDDPEQARHGLVLPLGGYKGYGLSLMVDILCGVLSGAAFGSHVAYDDYKSTPILEQNLGHFFLALDIGYFMEVKTFKARMDQMVKDIHACEPAPGVERIYVPGEMELETLSRRQREGIPIPMEVISDLQDLGRTVGEAFPGV